MTRPAESINFQAPFKCPGDTPKLENVAGAAYVAAMLAQERGYDGVPDLIRVAQSPDSKIGRVLVHFAAVKEPVAAGA